MLSYAINITSDKPISPSIVLTVLKISPILKSLVKYTFGLFCENVLPVFVFFIKFVIIYLIPY